MSTGVSPIGIASQDFDSGTCFLPQAERQMIQNNPTAKVTVGLPEDKATWPVYFMQLEAVGLASVPSVVVRPPRLALSPTHLECKLATIVEVGRNHVTIGEVVQMHIADEFYDPVKGYVATEQLDLIGRMHGRGWYARTTDLFEMPRLSLDEFRQLKAAAED